MNSISASQPALAVGAGALSQAQRIALLSTTALLALVIVYFIGVDQGMASVFGDSTTIHEWVHDGRHLLGYPCH